MSDRARTLGPPVRLVFASADPIATPTSKKTATGRPAATSAAATAIHLNTGLLPASGSGESRRALSAPGAQPMQAAPAAIRKTPKVAIDDLLSAAGDPGPARLPSAGRDRYRHLPVRRWRLLRAQAGPGVVISGRVRITSQSCRPSITAARQKPVVQTEAAAAFAPPASRRRRLCQKKFQARSKSLSRNEPILRANSSAVAGDSPTFCMIQVVIVSSRISRSTG